MKLTNKEAADVIMRIQIQLGRRNGKMLLSSALLKAVEVLREAPEWIPVSESRPTYTGLYLVSIDNLVTALSFDGTEFRNRSGVRIEVNAWMPLPKPYEEEGESDADS